MNKKRKSIKVIAMIALVLVVGFSLFFVGYRLTLKNRAVQEYAEISIPTDLELQSKQWKPEPVDSKAAGNQYWQYSYTTTMSGADVIESMARSLREAGYTIGLKRPAACTEAALKNIAVPTDCPFPNTYPISIVSGHKKWYSILVNFATPDTGPNKVVVYENLANKPWEIFSNE